MWPRCGLTGPRPSGCPRGRAIGVDLWRADQTKNSQQATLTNAALEGVADRIALHTADMTALPLPNQSVDVIVSNLAIHNIGERAGRRRALQEAIRVLRPGGRLAIADLRETDHHAEHLRELGWHDVRALQPRVADVVRPVPGSPPAWSPRPSRPDRIAAQLGRISS